MRVLHVLRKPLSEGTVAANVLKHAAGGINIDKARVAAPGEEITTHTQKTGEDGYASNAVYGDYEGGFTTHQTEGQKLGRWPANLILQHLDGCRCAGMKKVRSPMRKPTGKPIYATEGSAVEWNANNVRDTTVRGHADEDGKETVTVWVCVEGCPVKALDEQSGVLKSGRLPSNQYEKGGRDNSSMFAGDGEFRHTGYEADAGGASRFFKQVGGKVSE